MNFIILGAGSGLPDLDHNLSSILIQSKDGNFLVDCGEGVSKQLLRQGFSKDYLDAVMISHYHPDHISGIYMLIQMLYLEGRTKPLQLFLPERPAAFMETLRLFYTFDLRLTFALKVHEVKEIELYYANISSALTDHLVSYEEFIHKQNYPNLMQSYCFRFYEDNKSLVYTSDLHTFTNIHSVMQNCNVLIVDALHPRADLLITLEDYSIPRIILTHGISKDMENWMDNHPHTRFERAKENEIYQL